MIQNALELAPNYRFIVAKKEILAEMYLEKKSLSKSPIRMQTVLDAMDQGGAMLSVVLETIRDYSGKLLDFCRVYEYHNKIPSVVRNEIAKLIAGQTITPTLKANYLALGNGTTAPADADTTLQNELVRGLFTQRSASANVAYLDKFWGASEVGGLTILEVGTFIDGTATANSGFLLSRVATNIVVGSTETLTINVAIALTSAN